MADRMIHIKKDDCRILLESLDCYWESIAAGNYEESEKDDSERIPVLKTIIQEYMED